jgi:DNA modification methylase
MFVGLLPAIWTLSVQEISCEKVRVIGNEHPTQKPAELFAIPMRKHTLPGDICYELFCGSGSQIIAGKQWGRTVYAMDISPVFVDMSIRRWQDFSRELAVRESDKRSLDEIERQRAGSLLPRFSRV